MFRPKCTVNGVKSKGRMCSQIIVNGKLCGYDGDCVYKEGHKPNQYALGYKAGLDAAVNKLTTMQDTFGMSEADSKLAAVIGLCVYEIAALPVPSCASNASLDVQWRDLTDDETKKVIRSCITHTLEEFARAVIAKFKEKQRV